MTKQEAKIILDDLLSQAQKRKNKTALLSPILSRLLCVPKWLKAIPENRKYKKSMEKYYSDMRTEIFRKCIGAPWGYKTENLPMIADQVLLLCGTKKLAKQHIAKCNGMLNNTKSIRQRDREILGKQLLEIAKQYNAKPKLKK